MKTVAESRVVVYGARPGNTAIAITKFIVADITGGSSMLSKAIHSTVDTSNSVLLLVGITAASARATPSIYSAMWQKSISGA